MRKTIIAACVALCLALPAAMAQTTELGLRVQGGYNPPNHAGYNTAGTFAPIDFTAVTPPAIAGQRNIGSGWGGGAARVGLDGSISFPVLKGDSALTSGNNVALKGSVDISPVSVNASASASLTPIAFLKFAVGAGLGTGWKLGFQGLAVYNNEADPAERAYVDKPFGGLVGRVWSSATFQFDLAAIFPGTWNHVVFMTSPSVEYKALSSVGSGTAWLYEADDGTNFNGFRFKTSSFIGYQMPLVLSAVGFLVETEERLGATRGLSTIESGGWGSDFRTVSFGPVFNVTFCKRSSLAVLMQFRTGQDWTDDTTRNIGLGDRVYDKSYVYFYQLGVSWSLVL